MKFVFDNVRFDLQIRQFILQPLGLYAQAFSFLFANLHLLLQHDTFFNYLVVFGFYVLQRGLSVPLFPLKVIVCDFDIAQAQGQCPIGISKFRNFFLQYVLRARRFALSLLMFGSPLVDFILQVGRLVLQLLFALF